MSKSNPDYSRGYAAGRKHNAKEVERLNAVLANLHKKQDDERQERLYFRALGVALDHCHGWQVSGEKISNMEGYSKLAEIMVQLAGKHMLSFPLKGQRE